jgi:wobble nucleotide-excising tRNase
MITKINRLNSIGKFYNFSTKGPGLDWHNKTFIFALNAYGKSTLVNVFRSLRDNDPKLICARKTLGSHASPEAVLSVDGANHVFDGTKWNKHCPDIQIFDVPFVHNNILTDEIEHSHKKNMHKIIIGVTGVKLADELSTIKIQEKSKRQRLDNLRSEFNKVGFVHHSLHEFIAIPTSEESAVSARITLLEKDIKSKETETQARALTLPKTLTAPAFDLSPAKAIATKKLAIAHEEVEKRVLAHIEKNIADKERSMLFIKSGLDLVQADCPFCGQNLKNATELLNAYREFFDEAFRTFQTELKHAISQLESWNIDNALTGLVSSHNANTAIVSKWDPYIGTQRMPDIPTFVEEVRKKLNVSKTNVLAEIEKKQKEPNYNCDLSNFDAFTKKLKDLTDFIDSYNDAVSTFTSKAKSYIDKLPESDVDELRRSLSKELEIQKRFNPEWKTWAIDYTTVKTEATDLLTEKDAKQEELENYTAAIFNKYQKHINELLGTLSADFTITDLKGKIDERANESYSDFGFLILEKKVPLKVRQDDAPCFKNTLSEGDKSTLAFAFFIASLETMPGLNKQIVILDDPLSSLDETRREATARVLHGLSPKLNQLCVLTHKKDFLWMLCDKFPDNNVLQIRFDNKSGSRIECLDVEDDRKSPHAKIIEKMQRYIDEDFGPTPDVMQGNIRKAFEVVLKTKYYRRLTADIKAKKGLAKLLETLFDEGLIDTGLKQQLFDLCSIANGSHHGEIVDAPMKNLNRVEMISLINEALDILERV